MIFGCVFRYDLYRAVFAVPIQVFQIQKADVLGVESLAFLFLSIETQVFSKKKDP